MFVCLHKRLKMAKDSSSLVRPRKCEGLNIQPRLFLIDRVSNWSCSPLTSADCYRCPSLYCLAHSFPKSACPRKHYGVFDVFADFQSFFQPENLGFALSNVHRWQISTSRLCDPYLTQGSLRVATPYPRQKRNYINSLTYFSVFLLNCKISHESTTWKDLIRKSLCMPIFWPFKYLSIV